MTACFKNKPATAPYALKPLRLQNVVVFPLIMTTRQIKFVGYSANGVTQPWESSEIMKKD